jgi:hypothetical protein
MNPTKNLIEPKLYIIPTKNLIEPKHYMNPTKTGVELRCSGKARRVKIPKGFPENFNEKTDNTSI